MNRHCRTKRVLWSFLLSQVHICPRRYVTKKERYVPKYMDDLSQVTFVVDKKGAVCPKMTSSKMYRSFVTISFSTWTIRYNFILCVDDISQKRWRMYTCDDLSQCFYMIFETYRSVIGT